MNPPMHTAPTFDPNGNQPAGSAYAEERRRSWALPLVGLGVLALLVLLAGGLLVLHSSPAADVQAGSIAVRSADASRSTGTVAPAAVDAAPVVVTTNVPAAVTDGGKSTGGAAATPSPKPANPAPPAPPAPKPSAPAPVITSFATPENIDCHNGNLQNFSASWTTTNAVKVTISIDGPGVYKTYPANGSDSLPFNCSSKHTFLLTAYGQDGKTVSQSVTLLPRNVQVPTSDDGDQ